MAITIKEVAKRAGVSVKTVSRALNNETEISKSTRAHVLEVAREMGYRPNLLARSLVTGRTHAVGIIIPDVTDPFFPELILGAEAVAQKRGFNVFLCNSGKDPVQELNYVDLLSERQVDGMIIVGSRLDPEGLRAATKDQHVVILSPYHISSADLFQMDDEQGGYEVGKHLLELGHKCFGFVEGSWARANRYHGLLRALREQGLDEKNIHTQIGADRTVAEGEKAARSLLERNPQITAIFCYNDVMAIGVLQAARRIGRQVPKDLSIVGFDDIPEAERTCPPLTTFHFNRTDIGALMMNVLLDAIEGKRQTTEQRVIQGKLIVRETTCNAYHQG